MGKIIKLVLSIAVIIFFGFYGIIFFFADLGPGESWSTRLLIAFLYFLIFGAVLGFLLYPKWKLSAILVWAVFIAAMLNLPQALKEGMDSVLQALAMITIPLAGSLSGGKLIQLFKSKR